MPNLPDIPFVGALWRASESGGNMFANLVRSLATSAISVVLVILCMWGVEGLYSKIDRTNFPYFYETTYGEKASDYEKGVAVIDAIVNQMRYELGSTFGWSANDILFNKYLLDNRAYRQFGVYNATKILVENYSMVVARLGQNDKEDTDLFQARQTDFVFSPERWGFRPFTDTSEYYYERGLKRIESYKKRLAEGKAVYNCKTNDIYTSFQLVMSDKLLGYAIGILEDADKLPWYTVDNKIYEAQGIALVVRDFLAVLYTLYPVKEKYNEVNFNMILENLNKICTYDPLWMASYPFNNGTLIRSYLLNAKMRLGDVAESMRT
jgi:hypothetical protein